MNITIRFSSNIFLHILLRTSLSGRPVNGILRLSDCAKSTRTLYSLAAKRALEYPIVVFLLWFFAAVSNLLRMCLAVAVFPVPVFP